MGATITKALEAEELLAAKLSEYAGEWVAIRDHEVAEHAPTLRELLDSVEGTEVDRIFEVSDEASTGCFF
jgi:Family of unknown function (DUF5678)